MQFAKQIEVILDFIESEPVINEQTEQKIMILTKCSYCKNPDLDVKISHAGITVACHACGKAAMIGRTDEVDMDAEKP